MRLYLSSYRLGGCPENLLGLLGTGRRAAIIANALDFIPDADRRYHEANLYNPVQELAEYGVDSSYLDLRAYFGSPDTLQNELTNIDFVWVLGGNAFLLRRAMRQSAFDKIIRRLLREDVVAYGGFSAGAVVAAPTLKGIDLMDDRTELAAGYRPEVIWDGLNLVDFSIVPHYRSNHPEAPLADKAIAFMVANDLPYRAIADGEVLIVRDNAVEHYRGSWQQEG